MSSDDSQRRLSVSSNIVHTPTDAEAQARPSLLIALGERIRTLRARRGLTRKALAATADISERHLANLETGSGNASILVLQQVATALECPLPDLVGDAAAASPERLLIRELLRGRDEGDLRRARLRLAELFAASTPADGRRRRIALVGLRGAGKTTLGHMLADDLGRPFVELSRAIEALAGCSIGEIHALYGANAYRRYERRALDEAIGLYPEAVIATPGGLVSDPGTLAALLAHCFTVWLQADPEDHMNRVRAQGDTRPMAASDEAMEDLKRILAGRSAFYARADLAFDTSGMALDPCFAALRSEVRRALALPG